MRKIYIKACLFIVCSTLLGFNLFGQSTTTDSTKQRRDSTIHNDKNTAVPTNAGQQAGASTQQKSNFQDTSFKPVRRLWGYAFGDLYYKAHADALSRGGSNQYTGIAQSRNGFQFRRIYLGYDYDINKKLSAEVLLAAEDLSEIPVNVTGAPTTGNGDVLADNKFTFYIKLLDLRVKNIWKGTDLVIGQQATPAFPLLSERIWAYRSVERTVADIRRTPSFDLGIGLQGVFDPGKNNFGYNLLVSNGTSDRAENDIFKWFYGDVYAKFFNKKLIFDIYADYEKLAGNSATGPNQTRNMFKGYVAYTTPLFTVGIEAFTNKIKNGVLQTDAAKNARFVDLNAVALSAYIRGSITKNKFGYFIRYDSYNPETNFAQGFAYSKPAVSQYDPNNKEIFITAGFDYTPFPNIHFMPNIWYNRYTSQTTGLTGTAKQDHDMVYRATAFWQFGK